MLYEIINMSDPYTMECDSFPVASAAIMFLGEGNYGGKCEDESKSVPIMLMGGGLEWFKETHGVDFAAFADAHPSEIANALDTVLIGSRHDRSIFNDVFFAIADESARAEFRAKWDDKKRSSMNNIGSRARALAAHFREQSKVQGASK